MSSKCHKKACSFRDLEKDIMLNISTMSGALNSLHNVFEWKTGVGGKLG